MGIDLINTCMKIEQMSEILDKQVAKGGAVSNVERMSKAVRKVLTEDTKQMSQGKEAYEEARQRDFERKIAEDYKNPRKMTFTEMVNRYLWWLVSRCWFDPVIVEVER